MKKIILGFVALVMLSILFPLSPLAATTNNGDGTFTISGKIDNLENKTVTITVFKGKEQISENLMFIDEIQADETGNYRLDFSTKEVLSVNEPFYVKVASGGTVLEEQAIHHPDAKQDEEEDEENPAPTPDDEEEPEKPTDGTDKDETPTPGNNGENNSSTDKDENTGKEPSGKEDQNNGSHGSGDKNADEKTKDDDNLIPVTATNIFNILLIGLILLGAGTLLIKKYRRVMN